MTDDTLEPGGRQVVWLRTVQALLLLAGLGLIVAGAGAAAAVPVALALILLALPQAPENPERRTAVTRGEMAEIDAGRRALAEALPLPFFLLDAEGMVLFGNVAGLAALSLRSGDSVVARLRAPDFLAAFNRVATGGATEKVDYGERITQARSFAVWIVPIERGPPGRMALLLEDRTEIRSIERVRADFVANASHELRTPLASLSGFIETLQGPARDDPNARDRFLAVMHEQAQRMRRLIDDLLSLSRVEMSPAIRPGVDVDLVAVLRHVSDALAPLAAETGVEIALKAPAGPVFVPGSRDELVQLFENLVENACRYGAKGRRVEVSIAFDPARGEATAAVRDFGPGIPPEHLPRLTERFYRVDVEASRKHRGTGLGLAIVKHIAGRHRARLSVENAEGGGARFSVQFPQARLQPAVAVSAK
jgi:two-component system phosphate regulon sensor histidine kinase PhoR